MEVNIHRIDPSVELPEYKTSGAAGFDLAANETLSIHPRQLSFIRTGLVIQTPEDHMLLITARSSTARKHGLMLANGVGIIDSDYSGPADELLISVYNFTDASVTIEKGTRIAQGIFVPIERGEWKEIDKPEAKSRGGFGSTGTN